MTMLARERETTSARGAPRPNFFIAGSPKCGTSSLHDYLHQHPDCYMSEEMKEPGYFNPDLRINVVRRVRTEERYLRLFAGGVGKKAIGESSTAYMLSGVAAKLIDEWDPSSKAILMIRNPVDAAYSLHGQLLWAGHEDLLDFEEAFGAQADRAQGKRIAAECASPDILQYTKLYTFTPQIERFYAALGKDRVKVIVFDDFVKDTPKIYKDVLRFLDLDDSFVARFEVVNAMKPVAPRFARFFARRPRLRNFIHAVVPPKMQRRLVNAMPYYTKTVRRDAKLSPELRERIKPAFRDDVARLSELLACDLTHWVKERG